MLPAGPKGEIHQSANHILSVYLVPHISKTVRAGIAYFKASVQITPGAQTSTDEEVLRTGLSEIEGR